MITTVLTSAINHLLSDVERKDLALLKDKAIALVILGTPIAFYFNFSEKNSTPHVEVSTKKPEIIEAEIAGYPFSLISLLKRKTLVGSGIILRGQAEAAEALKQLLDQIQIDWEQELSLLTGDVVAYHASQLAKKVSHHAHYFNKEIAASTGEWLTEEKNIIVSEQELLSFYEEVDRLRFSTERLTARLQQLKTRIPS